MDSKNVSVDDYVILKSKFKSRVIDFNIYIVTKINKSRVCIELVKSNEPNAEREGYVNISDIKCVCRSFEVAEIIVKHCKQFWDEFCASRRKLKENSNSVIDSFSDS